MKADENGSKDKMELIHIATTLAAGTNRQIIATTRGHEILMDVRKERGGDDAGPTPPEFLAMALGGCILNICRFLAMEKQIELRDLRVSIAGDADPSRAFGLATDTRAGFLQLSVLVQFSLELQEREKEEFPLGNGKNCCFTFRIFQSPLFEKC